MWQETKKQIVLPPDIYDTLELGALVHKGIGASCLDQIEGFGEACPALPVCIMGHALWHDGRIGTRLGDITSSTDFMYAPGPVTRAVAKAFGFQPSDYDGVYELNDLAVGGEFEARDEDSTKDIARGSEARHIEKRISWKRWCKLLNVVRGPDPEPRVKRFPKAAGPTQNGGLAIGF